MMTVCRLAFPALLLGALALLPAAAPAARHSGHSAQHRSGHHAAAHGHARSKASTKAKAAKAKASRSKAPARAAAHRAAAADTPRGTLSVPGTGLKVYCPARKSPMLVRKFTQGSGTTVTVLCR